MRRVIVRYRVKPDQVERNAELVRAVYEELHRADPPDFMVDGAQREEPGQMASEPRPGRRQAMDGA